MKLGLMFATAIFALVSAVFWIYASVVRVRYRPMTAKLITKNGADFFRTIERQTKWNAAAAFMAGIAALCQAALVFY
jgi:hypothetical protein